MPGENDWSPLMSLRVSQIGRVLDDLIARRLLGREDLEGRLWVDLGTGRGVGAYQLRNHGANVIGVDDYESALNEGIKAGLLELQASVCQDALDYIKSLEDESIDGVSAFRMQFVRYHLPGLLDIYQIVLNAIKPLKRGGVIILTYESRNEAEELIKLQELCNNKDSDLRKMGLTGVVAVDLPSEFDSYAFVGRKS